MKVAAEELFAGTVEYYARHRPPYPPALFATLAAQAAPGRPLRLLDLGCGTGELVIPLSADMDESVAVDPSADMVRHGRAKARRAGRDTIEWQVTTAEAFTAPDEAFNLVTAGASFHWMDRRLVGARALRWLRPGGAIAIAGVNSTWNGTEEWQRVAVSVIQRWLGERRRAGTGTFDVGHGRHEDVLRAIGFVQVTDTTFPVSHTWTVEDFLGYLYSTSFASKSVLGDRIESFESDMQEALRNHDPSGIYTETLRFHCVIGHKPR
ncbi:class I SAM-dependent methyltransferase [Dactylosporangium sp. CA-092794]|uniref:class I SAM-dependent methyltransferase n=1 Tax=Dactylosporangium sp. CA-092794 TaxID=3239929 RepID=UPI003D8EEE33